MWAWTSFFLIISNVFVIFAVHFSYKKELYLESLILIQSAGISTYYHIIDTNPKYYNTAIWKSLKFLDFYCALLVLIMLSIHSTKLSDKYKSIPLIIMSTFIIFLLNYTEWGLTQELMVAVICFLMIIVVFFFRKKLPRWSKKNLFVGFIFGSAGLYCFHYPSYNNGKHYWLYHSLWHILIMLSTYFIMKIHLPTKLPRIVSIRDNMNNRLHEVIHRFNISPRHNPRRYIETQSAPITPRNELLHTI